MTGHPGGRVAPGEAGRVSRPSAPASELAASRYASPTAALLDDRKGRVTLVGAGPGDAGLLTIRGLRALEAADVIVADRLGARGVLDGLAAEGVQLRAEVVDVGKLPGHHAVPQDAINELLVTLALDGRQVVRLKGGDPFIFGRGGEELAYCCDRGIDVEVVPGITSAISVPAIAGIPLTHRGLATTFTVVTGHDQIQSLGGGRDHTVVLLMGIGTLANSAITLARGERGGDCPVAIIEDGYGPRQRVTVGTLDTIALQAARRGIRSPAVVVVGDVVTLSPYAPHPLVELVETSGPDLVSTSSTSGTSSSTTGHRKATTR
ncbi:uroporphyrinogen-III C-methyltransferase [Agromyces sp. NPDC057865]|uniref:uroporphyrinogen-III C-methyltransferase n=1 Tax=Agromyces sp. NPDC057865 TaxID=3346267 RepID=UPI003670B446